MPKDIKMSVPVSPEVHRELTRLAQEDRRPLGGYVAKLLEVHVARKGAK
jgi:predicted HicB family RNase H-like nuclease